MLFEPAERKSLAGFTATRHLMVVTELDNVRSRVYVLDAPRRPLASRAAAGRARVWRGERRGDRPRRVRRLLPERHRLPDARRRWLWERSAAGPADDAQAASCLLRRRIVWRSRSTRPSRRTARAFPTSRLPARTLSLTARTRPCSTATADSRSRCCRRTAPPSGRPGWRRGESTWSPTSAAAASSAPSGTSRRSRQTGYRAYDDFIAVGRRPDPPQGDFAARTWASREEATAAS